MELPRRTNKTNEVSFCSLGYSRHDKILLPLSVSGLFTPQNYIGQKEHFCAVARVYYRN